MVGGEDQVFESEASLLESYGHQVTRYSVHNDEVSEMGRLALAAGTVWRRAAARELRSVMLLCGARTIEALQQAPRVVTGELRDWIA